MRTPRTTTLFVVLSLAFAMPGCTDSRADRNDADADADAEARVHDDGGIDIQAPGIDVKIDNEGLKVDVETDGDGNTGSN